MTQQNLLFIMSDEHNPKMMGCAGHAIVRTPTLDSLSSRGTRFSSAYTNSPICAPARAAIATGRYVHDTRYWDNSIVYDGRIESWGHRLQKAGIRVESIGKLHFRASADPTGFDRQHIPMHIKDSIGMVQGLIRGQFPDYRPQPKAGPSPIVSKAGPGETSYIKYDRLIANRACEWLRDAGRRVDDRPWALFVSFVSPHYPLVVPQQYLDLYPIDKVPLPKLDPSRGFVPHPWYERMVRMQTGPDVTEEMKRRAIAAYLGLCTFMDEQVGRVLAALKTSGLEDQTQIIYTSDHGENAGSRGLWGKSVMYEESNGIPLIIAGPDARAGHVVDTPVSLVDVFPTVLDVFGLPAESALPGRSWYEIAAQATDPGREIISEYHSMGSPSALYMLRKGRYKLHYYVGYEPELFDLVEDPEETTNLATDGAHKHAREACVARLRAILDPEKIDAEAKADQKAFIERLGGLNRVLEMASSGRNYTEVPPEVEAVL